jgi:hypothetical protein
MPRCRHQIEPDPAATRDGRGKPLLAGRHDHHGNPVPLDICPELRGGTEGLVGRRVRIGMTYPPDPVPHPRCLNRGFAFGLISAEF